MTRESAVNRASVDVDASVHKDNVIVETRD